MEEGFAQSRDTLEGIGEIPGQVSADIDRTHQLVMGGINDFADQQRASLAVPPEEAPEESL